MSLPAGGAGYASSPADIHAYNVRTGALTWVFHTVPRSRRAGRGDVARRRPRQVRRRAQLERVDGRRRDRNDLHPDRHRALRLLRREPRGREPLRQQPARARRAQRQAALALPGDPSRSLGLRLSDRAEAAHGPARRRDGAGRRAAEQARLRLRVQPDHRRAALADRRAPRAAERRAGREELADAAVPDRAAAVRAPVVHRERHQSVHLGRRSGEGSRASEELAQRGPVHAAEPARNDSDARPQRRRELGQLRGRSAQRAPLRRLERAAGLRQAARARVRDRAGGGAGGGGPPARRAIGRLRCRRRTRAKGSSRTSRRSTS